MNKKNIGIIYAFLLFIFISKLVEANPLITEVYYAPPASEEDYVFVELYNPTSSPINLSNYKLADGEGTCQFPTGTVLPAYGTITIASKASGSWTLFFNKNPDFEYATETNLFVPNMVKRGGSFVLANTGDEVILSDASDAVIDVVVYEAGSYTGVISHSTGTTEGKSLQRQPPEQDTNDCSQDFIAGSPTPMTLRNIIVSPTAGTVGSLVSVSGQGFFATEGIVIDFGTTLTITSTTTDDAGSFSTTFTAIAQSNAGTITVSATGITLMAKVTTEFNLISNPEISFTKRVSGTSSSPGATLTYTLAYQNIGSGTGTNLVLIDGIPDGTTYISNSAYGVTGNIYYSHDGGLNYDSSQTAPVTHIKWEIGDVVPKGNGNVYFDVRVE